MALGPGRELSHWSDLWGGFLIRKDPGLSGREMLGSFLSTYHINAPVEPPPSNVFSGYPVRGGAHWHCWSGTCTTLDPMYRGLTHGTPSINELSQLRVAAFSDWAFGPGVTSEQLTAPVIFPNFLGPGYYTT